MQMNLTLIGMPGSGKSTTGVILAKRLSFGFVDTDVQIQVNRQKSLQQIIDEGGLLHLRKIEEEEIRALDVRRHVIATGGSAVYSEKAMRHLADISTVVFLKADCDVLRERIHNFETRGIAKSLHQTFDELFEERRPLYRRYARWTVDTNRTDPEETANIIASRFTGMSYGP